MSLRTQQIELISIISNVIYKFCDLPDFQSTINVSQMTSIKNSLRPNMALSILQRFNQLESLMISIEDLMNRNVPLTSYFLSFVIGNSAYPSFYNQFYAKNGFKYKINLHLSRLKKLINLENDKQDIIDFFLGQKNLCPIISDKHLSFMLDDFTTYLDETYPRKKINPLALEQEDIKENILIQNNFFESVAEECIKLNMQLSLRKLIETKKINLFHTTSANEYYGEFLMRLAATTDQYLTMEILHNHGVSLDSRLPVSPDYYSPTDFQGFTPLHVACFFGKEQPILYLFSKGAHYQATPRGITPAQAFHAGLLSFDEKRSLLESLIEKPISDTFKDELLNPKI